MSEIICRNLTLGYDGKTVIYNLNFTANSGDYVFVMGENGSGKTTFMKALLKLISPISGTVVNSFEKIGYLPQMSNIKSDFPASVKEVVLSGVEKKGFRPFYTKSEKEIAMKNMERLRIEELSERSFSDLSGGQRQRVLIARALCAGGEILLLDEPVNGLDHESSEQMYMLIKELNESGITIIMISHDIEAAKKYSNKTLNIKMR